MCRIPWLRSLLFWGVIDLDRSHLTSFQNSVHLHRFCIFEIFVRHVKTETVELFHIPHGFTHMLIPNMHAERVAIYIWTMKQSSFLFWSDHWSSASLWLRDWHWIFTSSYRFSPNYTHLTYWNFICQHSAITKTTVKQHPLAFILFDFQHWESPALYQSYF